MKYAHGIIEECAEKMRDAIWEAFDAEGCTEDARYACVNVPTNDGEIELHCEAEGTVEVFVTHDNESERECPTLVAAIIKALPDWWDVAYDWQQEWERDEPYRYSGLDPAFRSWAEVNAMFF